MTAQNVCQTLNIPYLVPDYVPWHPLAIWQPDAEVIYSLVRATKPELVVEYGTNEGASAAVIAQALHENGSGRLVTIDLHEFDRSLIPDDLLPLVEFVFGDGRNVPAYPAADLVFEDGPHTLSFTAAVVNRYHRLTRNKLRRVLVHDLELHPETLQAARNIFNPEQECGVWVFDPVNDPRGPRSPGLGLWELQPA